MSIGIGFETLRGSGASWRGGSIHFANWMHALRANPEPGMRLLLVEATHGTPVPDDLIPLADGVVAYPHLARFSAAWALNHARNRLLKKELLPDHVLRANGVEVLVCGVLERRTELPTLALLTDFQHRHLQDYFSEVEIKWRDAEYLKTAVRASRILVSGTSVRADFEAFAPAYADKVRILPPISYIPETIYARTPSEILDTYSLPQKFVYLPNQFWKHKNHLLAFEAVRRLREQDENIFIVCTGHVGDSRDPGYFSEVLQTISRWGIRDSIAFLPNVARADVFALIRQAAFVLNPSRFEGYGLSLDEARSVGKRILASDLPAHREQNAPCVEYFDPNSLDQLVEKLGTLWANTNAGPDLTLETEARRAQPQRLRASAEHLMQIIREVIV